MGVFDTIKEVLNKGGIPAFGLAMPVLAPDWAYIGSGTSGSDNITFTEETMTMTSKSGTNWASPLTMSLLKVKKSPNPPDSYQMPVTLINAKGEAENDGVLLTLFEQPYLRLCRIYAKVLENSPSGLPVRQVPRYFFYPGASASTDTSDQIAKAGTDLSFGGECRIYDNDGLPIDPLAVMAAFTAILEKYPLLASEDLKSNPPSPSLKNYLNNLTQEEERWIRLVKPDGSPYDGTNLEEIEEKYKINGIFKFKDSEIKVKKADTSFTDYNRTRLVIGPSSTGRMMDSFSSPESQKITLKRDFFTLRVVDLNKYLLGIWPNVKSTTPYDEGTATQRYPPIRINEKITLLRDGNEVLGAISEALPSTADPALVVAQEIDGQFPIPQHSNQVHWPDWPEFSGNGDTGETPPPVNLKNILLKNTPPPLLTANSIQGNSDVVLHISFPANMNLAGGWIRIYPRKFLADAKEGRGDGQGRMIPEAITDGNNQLDIYLKNPLSLPKDKDLPQNATLMFDMIVVLRNGKSRIYGNLSTPIDEAIDAQPFEPDEKNPCNPENKFCGICNAKILGGVGTKYTPSSTSTSPVTDWLSAFFGEKDPRDASRLPTMARRELLVAGRSSLDGKWTGVIGGGRIAQETVCADSRIGAPGSYGGRETIVTGAMTKEGRLAYDIARHAFRRSKNIGTRLKDLEGNNWKVPDEPAANNGGTFAGAVLQTIASYCETPELEVVGTFNPNKPYTLQSLTSYLTGLKLNQQLQNKLNEYLKNTFPDPPSFIDDDDASKRIVAELDREVTGSAYGRREAQWALDSAFSSARHLIYIETPGFCSTAVKTGGTSLPTYAKDLINTLINRLDTMPGLRVIVCVPKYPDFAAGYEGMAAYEAKKRYSIFQEDLNNYKNRVLAFHPIGFPGRFSRIETTVVIVDDVWALVGGCTIRRRGLSFDGSSDLVFTDTQLEAGHSKDIRNFRRELMALRLGIRTNSDEPSYVALNEARTAFSLINNSLGNGKITPLWDGIKPGETPEPEKGENVSNPDGREFSIAELFEAVVFAAGDPYY